jgi:hypothetical protein
MRKMLRYAICVAALLPFMQSCVDNDYDIDELNKNAVFKTPPVPFGDIDRLWLEGLYGIEFPEINMDELPDWVLETELPLDSIAKEQTLENLFTEDIIDKFFFEGAGNDVILEAYTDIHIFRDDDEPVNEEFKIALLIDVLDANSNVIEGIKILKDDGTANSFTSANNQKIQVRFPCGKFNLMKQASGLKLTFLIKATRVNIAYLLSRRDKDYIDIRNVILKTGGIHIKF